ncbi:MAG: galactokinase [Fidelibacterota bacterium]|nr:MAG: galactokinase [Candidatus Neomarinimicrobiota bacterium]
MKSRPAAVEITSIFQARFPGEPRAFRAPGRVNIIGEHTDNYDGYVFPIAVSMATTAAAAPRRDRTIRVWSENMQELATLPLDRLERREHWSDYVAGVAAMLEAEGIRLPGADVCIVSDVPIGGGLSSSAALEVSTAMAFLSLADHSLDGVALAKLGRRAENEFVGMNCGIMDQFVAVHAERGKGLLLDCRTLDYELVPLPAEEAAIVVCNTMVKHELGASEYNARRADTLAGTDLLKAIYPEVRALRDVSYEMFEAAASQLPEPIRQRCRHVITENQRVLNGITALKEGRLEVFGDLMNASHESLRSDYEVSCEELDIMVEAARGLPGVLGARMTGGGFGGCTVNLVRPGQVPVFQEEIARRYHKATGLKPDVHITEPMDGAREIT